MVRLLAVLTAITCAGSQSAQARSDPRFEFELAFGITGSSEFQSVILVSPLLTVSVPATAESSFVAQWGFSLASGDPSDAFFAPTYAAVGNPLLGWAMRLGEGLVFTPSLCLPLASGASLERDRPASVFAFTGALGLRGGTEPWLWLPDQLAIVLPLTFVRWFDPFLLEAHTKVGFVTPTSDSDSDSDFVLQFGVRLASRLASRVWLGATLSGVYTPTNTIDNFQSALAPELRYILGPGSHFEVALLMNLDTPLGPFTTPGRYWGAHLGGSTRF